MKAELGVRRAAKPVPRRLVLRDATLCLAGLGGGLLAAEPESRPTLRIGLLTDLHYADKPPAGARFYREAAAKLDEAVDAMNREAPGLVVELGDFIDQAESIEEETAWLDLIESRFARLSMPRHYVLGNHCVGTLTKPEFAARTRSTGGHEVIEAAGVTLLILDACFRSDDTPYGRRNFDWRDAGLPPRELAWLEAALEKAPGPAIVLAHQRLDRGEAHAIRNADEVRLLLENSGKVLAVFQGHAHRNDYQQIAGIHYTTLTAMVEGSGRENSGYAILDVLADGSARLKGFRRQVHRVLGRS